MVYYLRVLKLHLQYYMLHFFTSFRFMNLKKLQQILVFYRLIKRWKKFLMYLEQLLISTLPSFQGIPCKFNRLSCKRWFCVRAVSIGFLYINVNGLLFSTNSMSHSIVCNSTYVTLYLLNTFFLSNAWRILLFSHTLLSIRAGGVEFHLRFPERINF